MWAEQALEPGHQAVHILRFLHFEVHPDFVQRHGLTLSLRSRSETSFMWSSLAPSASLPLFHGQVAMPAETCPHQAHPQLLILLIGAVVAEQHDEWTEGRRYLGVDVLNRASASDHRALEEVSRLAAQPATA